MAIYQLANLTSSNNTFTGTNTFNNTITGSTNGNAAKEHAHDDKYYTKSEIVTKFNECYAEVDAVYEQVRTNMEDIRQRSHVDHTHDWSDIANSTTCTINTSGTITGSKVYGAVFN